MKGVMATSSQDALLRPARQRLAREFPELAGASAQVTPQGSGGNARYLVVFRGQVAVPGGRRLERIVRATVDGRGKILKWSTSR
jgi:hypothetical protein